VCDRGLTQYLSKYGMWTGCGQPQCTPSRQQVAHNETAKSLIPFSFPGGGDSRLYGPMCLLFLIWYREQFHCLLTSFLFFSIPTPPLSVQPADRQGQRCVQLLWEVLTLDWVDGLDWALPRRLPSKG